VYLGDTLGSGDGYKDERGKGSGPAGLRGGLADAADRLADRYSRHRADAAITITTTIDINKLINMHYRLSSGSRRESCAAGLR